MKRKTRLHTSAEIIATIRYGRKFVAPAFSVFARKNDRTNLRIACIVPTTFSKQATERNRIRRRAREWVLRSPIHAKPLDVVIIFRKEAREMPRRKFYEMLSNTFKKIIVG